MKNFLILITFFSSLFMANAQNKNFNKTEIELINNGTADVSMRVLQTTNQDDYNFLKKIAQPVKLDDKNLKLLADRMLTTVNDPNSKGVGIAAPQVGINKRAFWVMRMDKENTPFQFIINPTIKWYSDVKRLGKEGCLSIPDKIGYVYRSLIIGVEYFDLEGKKHDEIIEGFTAVIFQHEFDHLEGILFPDQINRTDKLKFEEALKKNELFYEIIE